MSHRKGPILVGVGVVVIALGGAVAIGAFGLDPLLLSFCLFLMLAWVVVMAASGYALWSLERLVWPKGVMGVDARGAAVEFRDLKRMPTALRLTRPEWKRVNDAARRRGGPRGLGVALGLCLVPAAAHLGLSLMGIDLPALASWGLAFLWLPFWVLAVRMLRVAFLRWDNPALVVIGRCPACGYDLTELPRESDGCVVCPECGSAWVLEDSVSGESINDSSGSLGQHGRPSPPPSP